jgi:Tol biopolymer transport system component
VAFTSDRSGNQQVWVADRNESRIRRVTAFEGASINVGSWSPDGRSLALDAVVAGNADIYVVSDSGGPLRRLTDALARESDPEWSRDGRWIYYASNVSGRSEIWRIPAAGGTSVQLTTHGGCEPREAADGRTIYYVDRPRRNTFDSVGSLKQVPAAGGPEAVVFSGVTPGAWDITNTGIVFLTGDPGRASTRGAADAVDFYNFADGRTRRIGTLPFTVTRIGVSRVLTVSRDGRWGARQPH